jgi:hypothetical protein
MIINIFLINKSSKNKLISCSYDDVSHNIDYRRLSFVLKYDNKERCQKIYGKNIIFRSEYALVDLQNFQCYKKQLTVVSYDSVYIHIL